MGSMNKGGNKRIQCTNICNQHSVYGEYICDVCKAFTDDHPCKCCGSPTKSKSIKNKSYGVAKSAGAKHHKMTHRTGAKLRSKKGHPSGRRFG